MGKWEEEEKRLGDMGGSWGGRKGGREKMEGGRSRRMVR